MQICVIDMLLSRIKQLAAFCESSLRNSDCHCWQNLHQWLAARSTSFLCKANGTAVKRYEHGQCIMQPFTLTCQDLQRLKTTPHTVQVPALPPAIITVHERTVIWSAGHIKQDWYKDHPSHQICQQHKLPCRRRCQIQFPVPCMNVCILWVDNTMCGLVEKLLPNLC